MQKVMTLIRDNRFEEAFETVKATNPFPGITGRACAAPCMEGCNRIDYDQGLAIKWLERAAADHARPHKVVKPVKLGKTGRKIAIVGSGPAALTCAYFSALLGHDVVVYEALPVLGGMTRLVPDYRLPKDVVDREIAEVIELGDIEVKTNTRVGKDILLEDIMKECDACFIATGAWHGHMLDIPGADSAKNALTFLSEASSGEKPAMGKKVLVIGGGSVAIDCACTALRMGAEEVHMAFLESKDAMLAPEEDIQQAIDEGVIFDTSLAPTRIINEKGRVSGAEFVEVVSFKFDAAGKAIINTKAGTEQVIPADTVILAIGESPELGVINGTTGLKTAKRGTLQADPETLATSRKGIFAGGDVVTGPDCIASSVGSGRRAAISIDAYLNGNDPAKQVDNMYLDEKGNPLVERGPGKEHRDLPQHVVQHEDLWHLDYFDKEEQVGRKSLKYPESIKSFEQISTGYTKEEAITEASRCFHCGHCFSCGLCAEDCLLDVIEMDPIKKVPFVAYPEECWHCADCKISCPTSAITIQFPLSWLI